MINNPSYYKGPVVTIDGPSGSGKGTVGQMIAASLGWHFLDSGSIYRMLALAVTKASIPLNNESEIANLAKFLPIRIDINPSNNNIYYRLDDKEVTETIRSESCGNIASIISKYPQVRNELLVRQRDFHKQPGLIADGRDMGTVVFPDAALKIFLEAKSEERAKRRYNQLIAKGINVSLQQILEEIKQRDERDRNRSVSPLQPANDAITLDTTGMNIGEVFKWVMDQIKRHALIKEHA